MNEQKITDNDKFAIVHIEGGHGKMISGTAFIRAIKKYYPDYKIVVVCAWDGPFFYNPDVFRFYNIGSMNYFFDDYMRETTKVFRQEVYFTEDHIMQKKHLTQSWCDMYGIPYDGPNPRLYLNPREIEIARDKIKPDGRPIMLLQTHGGGPGQYSKKSWARDMPIETAIALVDHFSKKYRILHIRREDQPALPNVEVLNLPFREMYAVFPLSTKRLFIDSFAQHVAAGLDLQSTVCWIANKPLVFGYSENINVMPKANIVDYFNKFSYIEQFDIIGQIQQFPFDSVNVFDIGEIIAAVEKQK